MPKASSIAEWFIRWFTIGIGVSAEWRGHGREIVPFLTGSGGFRIEGALGIWRGMEFSPKTSLFEAEKFKSVGMGPKFIRLTLSDERRPDEEREEEVLGRTLHLELDEEEGPALLENSIL